MLIDTNASTRAKNRAITLETDFRKVHANKYNYSKFTYTAAKIKSTIICKIHGEFIQNANDHLNGYGCYKCGRVTTENSQKLSTKDFIQQAIDIHGNTYNYSKVQYVNSKTPVIISCKSHGNFTQIPHVHTSANGGCPKCGRLTAGKNRRNTSEYFIKKARDIHGDLYDYSKVDVQTTNDNIKIICKTHGEFNQLQSNHLAGNGCPACARYGFKDTSPAILYYLRINGGEAFKIGITNRTIEERFRKDMSKIEVIGYATFLSGLDARTREAEIIKEYKDYKYMGKDLLESGNTELFNTDILNLTRNKK